MATPVIRKPVGDNIDSFLNILDSLGLIKHSTNKAIDGEMISRLEAICPYYGKPFSPR